jgi:sporulation protein YlmC with PRC-barrel domain
MNIRLASVYLDVSEQRIRALLREGRIKADKDEAGAWIISKEALEAYKAEHAQGPKRTSGVSGKGKAYVVRVPFQKIQAVKDFLATQDIELEQRYNYDKMKVYQQKRKARLAAEKKEKAKAAKAEAAS